VSGAHESDDIHRRFFHACGAYRYSYFYCRVLSRSSKVDPQELNKMPSLFHDILLVKYGYRAMMELM